MIESEILEEKYRVQKKLSEESTSIHDYLRRSHLAAEQLARSHGFRLQYAESLLPVSATSRILHPEDTTQEKTLREGNDM